MNCSVIRNKETNVIERVLDPLGNDSILYSDLLNIYNNQEEAVDLVMLSRTEEFKRFSSDGDWMKAETIIEPSAEEVIKFDTENSFIRRNYRFDTGVIKELEQIKRFIEQTGKDLISKLELYKGEQEKTRTIKNALDKIIFHKNVQEYNKLDTLTALLAALEYNSKEIPLLEEKLREIQQTDYVNLEKNIREEYEDINNKRPEDKQLSKELLDKKIKDAVRFKEQSLLNYLYNVSLFLQGYNRIQDIDTRDYLKDDTKKFTNQIEDILTNKENLTSDEINNKIKSLLKDAIGDKIDEQIMMLINIMKEYKPRIDYMQSKHKQLYTQHVEREVMKYTTNPELIRGVKKFTDAQYDENGFQRIFDPLADTNNPFIANLLKLYDINEFQKDKETKATTKKFLDGFETLSKIYGDKLQKELEAMYEKIDDEISGRLIQQYNEEFKIEYYKLKNITTDAINKYGYNSKEHLIAEEYEREWTRNNTLQEYTQDYIDLQNILSPETRVARRLLYNERNDLLRKYTKYSKEKEGKTYYDSSALSEEDRDNLININARLKKLSQKRYFKDGKWFDKTGEELKIAKEIERYNTKLRELDIYEEYLLPEYQQDFDAANERGELLDFRDYNEYDRVTEEYYDELSEYDSKELPEFINEMRNEIKELASPYKEFNDVYVRYIPQDILDRINELQLKVDKWFKEEGEAWFENIEGEKKPKYLSGDMYPSRHYILEERHDKQMIVKLNNKPHPLYYFFRPDKRTIPGAVFLEINKPRSNYSYREIKDKFKTNIETRDKNDRPIPINKWLNPEYVNLKDSKPEIFDFYENLRDLLLDMVSHFEGTIIDNGYLPAISNKDVNTWDILINGLGWYKRESTGEVNIDMRDNIIKHIPLNFVNFLGTSKQIYTIPKFNKDIETYDSYETRVLEDFTTKFPEESVNNISDIREYNRKAKEENKKEHGKSINYDLEKIIPLFIKNALNHKYKTKIQHEMLLARDKLAKDRFYETRKLGKRVKIRDKNVINKSELEDKTIAGEDGTNLLKHYDMWLDMVFYENFEKDEGMLTTFARVLQNYTSLKGIGFNPFSGIKNVSYGQIQIAIEMASGYFFDKSDWWAAKKAYTGSILKSLKDTRAVDGTYSSLWSAIFKELNILESQDEKAESNALGTNYKKAHKILMVMNAAYIFQHIGEHSMQNQGLIAMMKSHRIIESKVISFANYKELLMQKTDPINKTKEENNKIIENNKRNEKRLKEKFLTYPTVESAFTLKDGYLIRDENLLSDDNLALFRRKVIAVNQKIHGVYNKQDAGTLQHVALGRLAIQFKKWLPEGVNRRFYGISNLKDDERFDWNERREEQKEGMYVSMYKLLSMPIKTAKQKAKAKGDETLKGAMKALFEDLNSLRIKNNVYWHSMSETQKANVKRVFADAGAIFMLMAILGLAKGLKDDDEEKSWAYNLLIYELDATLTELRAYTPVGLMNEGKKLIKSPAASLNSMEQILKLGGIILRYPFWDEDERLYKGGRYHGQDKLLFEGLQSIPVVNQFVRAWNLRRHMEYFKLYS